MEEAKAHVSFLYQHVLLAGGLVDVFLTFIINFLKNSWFAMTILTVTGKKPSNKGQKLSCCHIISQFNVSAWALSHLIGCLVECPFTGTGSGVGVEGILSRIRLESAAHKGKVFLQDSVNLKGCAIDFRLVWWCTPCASDPVPVQEKGIIKWAITAGYWQRRGNLSGQLRNYWSSKAEKVRWDGAVGSS